MGTSSCPTRICVSFTYKNYFYYTAFYVYDNIHVCISKYKIQVAWSTFMKPFRFLTSVEVTGSIPIGTYRLFLTFQYLLLAFWRRTESSCGLDNFYGM